MDLIKNIFKKILILLLLLIFVGIIFVSIIVFQGYKLYTDALSNTPLEVKIAEIKSDNNYVLLDNIATPYKDAVISAEDRRFYDHGAIDIISITRALVTNIEEREFLEGGSTITQQVAKNIYFTQKKEATRKIAEIFMAFYLEDNLSKDEILEIYVNTCYFGKGYYGIKEASVGYFKKEPKNMNLYECTLIAGVPNAPSVYSPAVNPDLAKKRQSHIIKSMIENGYLTQEEADSIY